MIKYEAKHLIRKSTSPSNEIEAFPKNSFVIFALPTSLPEIVREKVFKNGLTALRMYSFQFQFIKNFLPINAASFAVIT